MDSNRIEGTAQNLGGRVQEAAGSLMGDSKTKAQGAINQAQGQAQDYAGQIADQVREQPLMAALVALGLGFIIGRLSA